MMGVISTAFLPCSLCIYVDQCVRCRWNTHQCLTNLLPPSIRLEKFSNQTQRFYFSFFIQCKVHAKRVGQADKKRDDLSWVGFGDVLPSLIMRTKRMIGARRLQ